MKTLVICYSYTGKTKKMAEDLAKKESADLVEVREKNPAQNSTPMCLDR